MLNGVIVLLTCIKLIITQETKDMVYLINSEEYNITHFNYFNCTNSISDCSNSGQCSTDKEECLCFEGYQTMFENLEDYFSNKPRCNYKVKKQLEAFILALFFSFGSLHFYLGNYIIGYIQLFLFLFILFFNVAMIINLSIKHLKKLSPIEYRSSLSNSLFICFFASIAFFWYIFDVFMVLFNIYKDDRNIDLQTFFPA